MPLYEYQCKSCSNRFEELTYAQSDPHCPHCQTGNVQRLMSVIAVLDGPSRSAGECAGPCATGEGACGPSAGACGMGACSLN